MCTPIISIGRDETREEEERKREKAPDAKIDGIRLEEKEICMRARRVECGGGKGERGKEDYAKDKMKYGRMGWGCCDDDDIGRNASEGKCIGRWSQERDAKSHIKGEKAGEDSRNLSISRTRCSRKVADGESPFRKFCISPLYNVLLLTLLSS